MRGFLRAFRLGAVIGGLACTVHAQTQTGLQVTPDTVIAVAGSTVFFTAQALYDTGGPVDVTSDSLTFWFSTDTPGTLINGAYTARDQGLQWITAEYGGFMDTVMASVTHGTGTSLVLSPGTLSLVPGDTASLNGTFYDQYGNGWDTTAGVFFEVIPFDSGIAVTGARVTAYNPGTYHVRGMIDSVAGTMVVHVASTDSQAVADTGTVTFSVPEVTMKFRELGGSGTVTLAAFDDALPPLAGQLTNPIPVYYELHAGSGISSFRAVISFSYSQAGFDSSGIAAETLLQCLRLVDSVWTAVPSSVDTLNNVVSCVADGFSYWTYGECTGIGACGCDMELLSTPPDTALTGNLFVYFPEVFGGSLSGIGPGAPAGLTRSGSAVIWTPGAGDVGAHEITLLFTGNCRDTSQTFTLEVVEDGAVPVELSFFTAAAAAGGVELQWRTETEEDNLGFHVERSSTADYLFGRVTPALIPGQGTSSAPRDYTWTDTGAGPGEWVYRLQMIDVDGTSAYSPPAFITVQGTGISASAVARFDAGRLHAPPGSAVTLTDLTGKTVFRVKPDMMRPGGIPVPGSIAAGMFMMSVEHGGGVSRTMVLIIR